MKKAQQLEVELDKTKEELMTTTQKLEEKEKALLASELEVKIQPKPPYILQYQPLLRRCPPSTDGSRVWRGTWRHARTSCCSPRRSLTRYLAVQGRNNMYLQLHYIYGSVFDAFFVLLPRNVTYISSNIKILNSKQIFKCSNKYNFEKQQFLG